MSNLLRQMKNKPLKMFALFLTAPIIYGMFFVFLLADICATVYQLLCFPVYGIPKVKRSDYVVMDRGKLEYLDLFGKLNCIYCEYANGIVAYTGEVIARTEWFWCPIKHGKDIKHPHDHYDAFLEYGDKADYRRKLKDIRKACRACDTGGCATKTPQ